MCGRFIDPNQRAAESYLRISKDMGWLRLLADPRYNIAPTQSVVAIKQSADGEREGHAMHWGLIPTWAKDRKIGYKTFNARGETVAEKPSFRRAFKERRCVIPIGGFYEWRREGSAKQPYFIRPTASENFNLAGLWEQWLDKETGEVIHSCTVVTCEPNDKMAELHNRMPVVLETQRAISNWLSPDTPVAGLIKPCDNELLDCYPVSSEVNNARHEGAHLTNSM